MNEAICFKVDASCSFNYCSCSIIVTLKLFNKRNLLSLKFFRFFPLSLHLQIHCFRPSVSRNHHQSWLKPSVSVKIICANSLPLQATHHHRKHRLSCSSQWARILPVNRRKVKMKGKRKRNLTSLEGLLLGGLMPSLRLEVKNGF